MNILISACLIGVNCRYNGTSVVHECVQELMLKHSLIPICPEIFGGMPTPRDPAEQMGDKVFTCIGEDVTDFYTKGAMEVVKLAKLYACEYAILKERSPSCGSGEIYDGTFSHIRISGDGVLAGMLKAEGVTCIGETKAVELLRAI